MTFHAQLSNKNHNYYNNMTYYANMHVFVVQNDVIENEVQLDFYYVCMSRQYALKAIA